MRKTYILLDGRFLRSICTKTSVFTPLICKCNFSCTSYSPSFYNCETLSRENERGERILRVDGQKGRFSNTMMSCISQCMPSKGCYSPLFYQFLVDGRKRFVHAMYDKEKESPFSKIPAYMWRRPYCNVLTYVLCFR